MSYFPHLFEPLQVGNVRFRNRIWNAPTATALQFLTPEGFPNSDMVAHFRNRALGGAAVVTIGETAVDWNYGRSHYHSMSLFDNKALPYLTLLSDAIHGAGAMASIELSHGGQYALPELIGKNPIGPSAKVLPTGAVVDEMNEEQMDQIADNFAKAVAFVQSGGFNMVLIHGAHGWCLGQFLSPLDNRRTDNYGGSLENRARFPMMVLDRIRAKVGDDIIIEYRVSGSEGTSGGLEIDECIQFVKMIEDKIDLIHVSQGIRSDLSTRAVTHPSGFLPHGPNVYLAEAVKRAGVKIPVIAVGGITDPVKAEQIIAEGRADVVALARASIADPNWVNKTRRGQTDEIVPCTKCFNCLDEKNGRVSLGHITSFSTTQVKRYACAVNPLIGLENEYIRPSTSIKRVYVIGGGPAGMQAAITASERGHEVILFEKRACLGGQLGFADNVSFKADLKAFKEYLIRRVSNLNIKVFLDTEAEPEMLKRGNPGVLIAALGAIPIAPKIPGIEASFVVSARDACANPEKVGQNVVVVGGGQTGCESALHLAYHGKHVSLVEMLSHVAADAGFTYRNPLVERLDKEVKYMTGARCTKINNGSVEVLDQINGKIELEADTVVIAVGSKASVLEADRFRDVALDFYPVGDCYRARNVKWAIRTAYGAAIQI